MDFKRIFTPSKSLIYVLGLVLNIAVNPVWAARSNTEIQGKKNHAISMMIIKNSNYYFKLP